MAQSTQVLESAEMEQRIQKELRKKKVAKLFKSAIKYGVIKPGWSFIDYELDAIKRHGWQSTCISGPKGTLKSNLMMQHGYAIYREWPEVKAHIVMKRQQLLDHLEYAIEHEEVIPWLGVDDIAAIFPRSLYFSHRKLYSELQANWEVLRTVINCFEYSCVIKRKVATFILEDATGDIKCFNRVGDDIKGHYDYRRWMWLRDLNDPTKDVAKLILVEDIPFPVTPDSFKIDKELSQGKFIVGGVTYIGKGFYDEHALLWGIPRPIFKEYWDDRLGLARDSFKRFKGILEPPVPKRKLTREERAEINRQNAKKGWED